MSTCDLMKTNEWSQQWVATAGLVAMLGWGGVAVAAPPVAGPKVWLTAEAGIVNDGAGKVERWEDQSGNNLHFEQAVDSQRPQWVAAGLPKGGGDYVKLLPLQDGNSNWGGTLGSDFIVDEEVVVTDLAAFDHSRDGFSNTITVQLWQRNDGGTALTPADDTAGVLLEQLVFTPADPGTLSGSHRWKSLTTPRTLSPGAYTIFAWGFTGSDYYCYNPTTAGAPPRGIRTTGTGRYSNSDQPSQWPQNLNGDYYRGAANLRFHRTADPVATLPAVQFDGADDGLQAVAALDLGQPSTVFIAYQRTSNDFGYIMQNSSGPHWFIRSDGYYNQGWIRYAEIPWGVTQADTMLTTATGTRAWRNQSELTLDGSLAAGSPNRLALGGGNGIGYDPIQVKVAEVIAYDRQLSEAEILATQNYLGQRYGIFAPVVATPEVLPMGDLGTGTVAVTISSGTTGAQIRYTTDGSEPGAASTLYGGSFTVPRGTSVKARAFLTGLEASGVAVQYYGSAAAAELPVTGASMWLRADRGVETDATGMVSRWRDLTGSGNDMLQASQWQRPGLTQAFSKNGGYAIYSTDTASDYNHDGTLGADFVVTESLQVTELGAHDSQGDNFGPAVTVQIWTRDDHGTPDTPSDDTAGVLVAEMEFTNAAPGTLVGLKRYKPLAVPVTLAPGAYSILAWGYTGVNYYKNSSDGYWNEDGLRFVGNSRYGYGYGTWPTGMDSHPVKYNGCGNFRYHKTAAPETTRAAVAFDGADDGMWAAATSNLPRPATVYTVFDQADYGDIIQSTSNGWWFIRSDGAYADGWVINRYLGYNRTLIAGMTAENGATRFYLNGEDWTVNPSVGTAAPGRLALGGGNGYSIDPVKVKIAEVVAFHRILTEGERWQVENYLAGRYKSQPVVLPPALVMPASNYGTGNVTVSLSHPVTGAVIHYTTDGSVPTAVSPIYNAEFSVPRNTRVRALGVVGGTQSGVIAEAYYGASGDATDLPVTGASMWLRAEVGVETDASGQVRRWRDLTGNGNDLQQDLVDLRPRLLADGFDRGGLAAIQVADGNGAHNYAGSLGEDFVVTSPMDVTHLGAFDHMRDGFSGTITVQLWRRNDNGTPDDRSDDSAGTQLAELTFTTASPGSLEGPLRFKPLAAPVALAPGAYTVFAWGYTGADQYIENTPRATARGDSRFHFVGNSRYSSTAGAWPTSFDSGPLDYNGAANFKVTAEGGLPVRPAVAFDGADDGLLGVASMNIGRPSTVLMVFRKENGDSGYMLQNSGGGNWWFRNDGFYSDGWVRYDSFASKHLYLAAMASSPTFTRAYLDGFDVTGNSALTSPAPGRLVMGGGGGQQNDPVPCRVAELVVYPRVLNAGEMWQIQSYLATRHGIYQVEVDPPTILPVAGYGTGDVEVTLATTTPAAEIRYTTNGSEPTAGSALYGGTFTVPRNTTVKARAFLAGVQASAITNTFYGLATSHPLPVTDVALWLRGDSGVELRNDGTVSRWRDLSGNGRDAMPSRPSTAPSLAPAAVGGSIRPAVALAAGLTGSANNNGAIGTDFIVDEPVEITHLGAFDSANDGFAGTITVRLHRMNDNGTPANPGDDTSAEILATQTFTTAAPGSLDGSTRYLALATPLSLVPGRYFIESSGWTGADVFMPYETYDKTLNAGISFPAVSRYDTTSATVIPGNIVGDSRYLANTSFKFRKPGATAVAHDAVRFDGVNDGLLGPADYLLGRPSTIFMVFNQLNGTDGRLLQSGSGNNFLLGPHIGTDGLYCDGWVATHTIPRNQHSHVVGVYEGNQTRYFYNGQELTLTPGYTGVMGRLALGGAEGTYFQPCNADLAELIIYQRALSETERQQVTSALAVKYDLPLEPILPPVASPDGGYYATGQTLVYSHPISGVEIRYTTDGSEPTAASALSTGPLVVAASGTYKAKAFKAGYLPSGVQESVFTVDPLATYLPQRSALQLWLRAGINTETSGGVVSRWRDLSGNGMDASQTTVGARPTLNSNLIGGAPGVVFDGTNDFMSLPPGLANFSQGLTAIVVARPTVAQYWERIFDFGNGAGSANILLARSETTNNLAYGVYASYNKYVYVPEAMPIATNAIYTVTQQPGGAVKIHHNGSLVVDDPAFPLPTNIKRYSNLIGTSNWSGGYYAGALSELILYDSALNDLERETLEAAVRVRYGIASTATATVAFSPDPAQLYPSGVDVTLTCVTPASQIHYTLDGSQPDEASPLYSPPLHLNSSARIRARAFTVDFNPSPFSEATYLVGQPPSSGDGFLGTYYDNIDFTGASLTRVDPTINFDWGGGSPDPAIGPDQFSVRWTGKLMPRFSESYTFYTATDDGQRLWVDLNRDGDFEDAGELLIDDWTQHGESERAAAPVPLVAGQLYDFKMEMFENGGGAVARLRWSSFSEPKGIIPQSQGFSNAQFAQTVTTPVISPAGGTYTAAVNVTIATATTGATVYYSTDGSIPDTNSQVFGGSFPIGADATVRARAYKAGFNPSGVASTAYHIDAQPPVISQFAWDGAAISNGETFTRKGTFTAQATDNQGVASAEFFYQPTGSATPLLVGRDIYPNDGLSAAWDIATISDGAYTVTVRTYDVAGAWSEVSRTIRVALATPSAPVIVSPASGATVQDPVVALHLTAQAYSNLRLYRDNVLIFSGYASYDGTFNYSPSLPTGSSVFKAVAVNRAGSSPDSNAITVNRVREFPQLQLTFDNNTVVEGAPVNGTITLAAAEARDLTVQVTTNKASQMISVDPVIIPAGATTGSFMLAARQDTEIELLSSITVTVSAVEHRGDNAVLFLGDDDYPTIELTLDQTSVAESYGTVVGVVRRTQVSDRSVRVTLQNTNPSNAATPEYVDIPANQTEASFSVTVINDTLDDGNQLVKLRGVVVIGTTSVAQTSQVTLEVRDDEGPLLTLALAKPFLAEGAGTTATVTRSGGASASPLLVTFSQTPTGQLVVPASVTIPAGQDQATFAVSAPNNPGVTGTRAVTLRASSADFTDGLFQLAVTDETKPELNVSNLSAPVLALTEAYASVSYQITNQGTAPAVGPYSERIFLSRDLSPSPDDILVRQLDMTGEVAAGGYYGRNTTVLVPRTTGIYYMIVTVDPGDMVAELNEGNNTAVLIQPIEVRAAYGATVQTAVEIVPTNTPVVFTGSATRDNGTPAAFSMVNIHLKVSNTTRIIAAITNSLGQFTVPWTPLRNEGGIYTIGACHPGTDTAPPQDSFEILTMGLDAPPYVNMNEAETVVVQGTIRNPNGRALHGMAVGVTGMPSGLTITPNLPSTTLATGTDMQVSFTVSANAGFSGNGSFPITVTTIEGVTMQTVMGVNISLLTPSLSFNVGSLDASVLRGGSNSVSFKVTNTGGLETGPVQLLLPAVPWLTLASANPLPSIPPGGSADVSLLLAPDATVPLTLYTGSMAINPANGAGRGLGYNFRVVSDLRGDLTVDVVDELFFFTAEAPKLAGAQVVIRDAVSSAQVASTTTGVNGLAAFTSLPEGWYRIDVSAPEHDSFSGNYYVNAGQNNTKQIFISKQLVKYSWKVEEVEIQDVYRVTIETKFETNVPAPVVTATPSAIDVGDLVALGQTKTVNITLENHGFIAAQHSKFRFSEHPFYSFTPLVENIGTIPAKSSLVVPVTVRRIGVFGDDGEIITEATGKRGQLTKRGPGGGASVPCGAAGAVDYNYPCGEWLIEKVVVLAISGVQGNCSGTGTGTGGYIGFVGGFYGGYSGPGGGPGGTGPGTSSGSVSFSSPDPCLAVCLARAIADCAIGFLPIGCFYSAAQCIADPGLNDTCIWALAGCAGDLAGVGPVINAANCIYSFGKCFYQFGGGGGGGGPKGFPREPGAGQFVLDTDFRNFAPETAEAWSRCEPVLRMYEFHYGSKELALAHGTPKGRLAMVEFSNATLAGSPGGVMINGDETIGIEALAVDAGLDLALVQRAIARWNRTKDYHARGIFELADVPAGESADFMDLAGMREIAAAIVAAFDTSRAKGFIDPFHEFLTESANLRQTLQGNQGGTCATVKIQLSQDVVMTRTAFRATLELQNERTDGAITEVGFNLRIQDEIGQPSEDLFNVQVTKLTGLAAIDGTGEIPSSSTGSAQWTLIPRDTAAQETIRKYTVGGVIHYKQNGTEFNIPVENVPITVRPDASLKLKYFHQRDVLSDDPHTDPIEPSIPYKLAVMVENNGHGDARNLHIISGQPQIVDNEKGLFIDFKVIATEVDGMPLSPSLTAEFGTLTPGQRKIATWYLTSTLQGLFTDYKATFEHVTGLGDSRISLMDSVEIHEMIRMIRAQGTLDDGAPDFLTNDVKDANDYPDTVHYSNGGTDLVTLRQTGTFSGAPGPGNLTITLNTGAFTGWSYIRLPDPALGNYRLASATRADGRVLPLDFNVWQSDRTFIGGGRRPLYENILHLADHNSSGDYTLVYEPLAPPDSTPPSSVVTALPALSPVNIPVWWSGTDNVAVSHYDIYVAADGGSYSLWKNNTTELGGLFVGSTGSSYSFYSIATDNAGNSETKAPVAEATTQVAVVNLPPVIGAIADATVDEGGVFTLQAVATDPDGPAAAVRFSIGSDRAGVVIDPVTGIIRWNTSEADGGVVAHLIVVATDSGFPAAVANRSFTITVRDVNSPPTIMPVAPQTVAANGVLIVDADAADGDSPQQTLNFALAEAPAGATIDPASGVIQWLPTTGDAGRNHVFTITVTDNGSPLQAASTSFTATVIGPVDRAPVFTQVPVVLWLKGKSYSLSVTATDPDGDPVALTANTAAVAGALFADAGGGNGSLSWNTTGATAGTYAVPVTATANGVSTNATVRIRVENDELYWQWARDLFGQLPTGFDLSLLGMDADPDGDKRANVHEMALLTHPLVPDSPPIGIRAELLDPFAIIGLNLHRRKGSEQYVDFDLASSPNPDGPWHRADRLDWSAFIDAAGDDDGRAETEKVDFELFELYPGGVPQRNFYRIETTRKQP